MYSKTLSQTPKSSSREKKKSNHGGKKLTYGFPDNLSQNSHLAVKQISSQTFYFEKLGKIDHGAYLIVSI